MRRRGGGGEGQTEQNWRQWSIGRGEECGERRGGLFQTAMSRGAYTNDLSVSLSAGPVSAGTGKHVS